MKAVITEVSSVDVTGIFTVTYDMYNNDVLAYSKLTMSGSDKTEITKAIRQKLYDFNAIEKEKLKFQVGDEISIV